MPVPASRRKANDRYNARCDSITIRPLKDKGTAIRTAAQTAGESLQGYILKAVEQRMERDAQQDA